MNKRLSKILSIVLTVIMLAGVVTIPAMADEEIKVKLNGVELTFDVPPQTINDRTMVPMRKIFESLGATVEWDEDVQVAVAKKGDIELEIKVDSTLMTKMGRDPISIDVPPQMVNDRVLVPIRAIAEGFDAEVTWDEATQTVNITTVDANTVAPNPTATPTATEAPSTSENTIKMIDLNKEKVFICNVGAAITYGFDDMWNKTVGTGFDPIIKTVDHAYRGQTILISPLYANFAIDKSGKAKVAFTIKRKKANGEETVIGQDIVAFEGLTAPKQIIKSTKTLEYMIDDSDPLGTYTFTIESKDVVGNKTTTNVFNVEFSEYKYTKNEFKSSDEFGSFYLNYAKNPQPERITDAIIYAVEDELLTNSDFIIAFSDMLAKNPYLMESNIEELQKKFGNYGTETLKLLEDTATEYLKRWSDKKTITYVELPDQIQDDMGFGACLGLYFTSGSYDAAKMLTTPLEYHNATDAKIKTYYDGSVYALQLRLQDDPLFKAYCIYMRDFDDSVSQTVKDELKALLN